jgi:hypothetical protein
MKKEGSITSKQTLLLTIRHPNTAIACGGLPENTQLFSGYRRVLSNLMKWFVRFQLYYTCERWLYMRPRLSTIPELNQKHNILSDYILLCSLKYPVIDEPHRRSHGVHIFRLDLKRLFEGAKFSGPTSRSTGGSSVYIDLGHCMQSPRHTHTI